MQNEVIQNIFKPICLYTRVYADEQVFKQHILKAKKITET